MEIRDPIANDAGAAPGMVVRPLSTAYADEAAELIRTANLSGYWESYGAMTGMFMAREIDLRLGRGALIQTISDGPLDMLSKYAGLTDRDDTLPKLSDQIIRETGQK